MTYNKSEIMKTAWRYNRNSLTRKRLNIATFADALRAAWREAKDDAWHQINVAAINKAKTGYVSIEHLNAGDTIEVAGANGGYFPGLKVIASIASAPLGFAGKAISFTDGDSTVVANIGGTVKRVAAAA